MIMITTMITITITITIIIITITTIITTITTITTTTTEILAPRFDRRIMDVTHKVDQRHQAVPGTRSSNLAPPRTDQRDIVRGILRDPAPVQTKRMPKPVVQRDSDGRAGPSEAPKIVHDVLSSGGSSLDPATRAFMEPRFEHDFSHVRVHTDARAAESASAVNARAYTVGSDIVFGSGQFDQASPAGRRLLAHELAHTLQQGGGGIAERSPNGGQFHGPLRRTPFPGDGMTPPGDCGLLEYAALWTSVETAKAVVDGLGGCRAGDDCSRLAFKIAAVSAEIAARVAMMVTCFRGGDTHHREQVANKQVMLERCFEFFNRSNCPPNLVAAMAVVVAQIRSLLTTAMLAAAAVVVVAAIAALIAAISVLIEVIVAAAAALAEGAAMAATAAAIVAVLAVLSDALGGDSSSEG
jgi:hypothetical protein